jgi:hypothetical protein
MPNEPVAEPNQDPRYREAKEHVEALKGFYVHLLVYVCVMSLLFGINILTKAAWWAQWPLLGWGIGILIHAVNVFSTFRLFGKDWERRKIEEQLRKM